MQMAFGGHHARAASDQLQQKLQEDMGDADDLASGMAGMDVKDPKGENKFRSDINPKNQF